MWVNLTPHDIKVCAWDDEPEFCIESSGVARADQTMEELGETDYIRIVRMSYGAPVDLPEPEDGVRYIVSALTAAAAKAAGRTTEDLYLTADLVRDEAGRVIGCRALAVVD